MREKWHKTDFSHKPSAIESEIHPSHKSDDLYSVYFALPGANDSVAVITNADAFVVVPDTAIGS